MKKIYIFLFLLALSLIIIFIFFQSIPREKWSKACINSNCFSIELAETNAERAKGLMYKAKLGQYNGMLFVFDKEGIYPFWMKNTLMPLDIIWIDKDQKIVFMAKDSQPCELEQCVSINPEVEATYVLEINAGFCDGLDIKVGDAVIFE